MNARINLNRISEEELLDLRICDLPIRIAHTSLEDRIVKLYHELENRRIRFKPHFWLSVEWFSPDGVPGIAIPFYLAHPRLVKLEHKQMLEVEGGTEAECMRILRHEAGHAMDTAYRLHFRRRWRELFGPFTKPYPESYRPKPNSRKHVLHLRAWYAQAHPAEDFAETFAVWLTPGSRWRSRYKGWTVMRKLEYVESLMEEVAGKPPLKKDRRKIEPLSEVKITLREHYRRKKDRYETEWPPFYDKDLRRIFSSDPKHRSRPTAASFLRSERNELREMIAEVTGIHAYTVDYVLKNMIERCKELKLRLQGPASYAKRQVTIMLTMHAMHVIHSGYYRIAL